MSLLEIKPRKHEIKEIHRDCLPVSTIEQMFEDGFVVCGRFVPAKFKRSTFDGVTCKNCLRKKRDERLPVTCSSMAT